METRISARDKAAFNRVLKVARLGEAQSQYELGLMYANGIGVAQDVQKALHWVRLAAEKGYSPAQYLLATRYAAGIAVDKDDLQAMVWYVKAAEQQHPKALHKLGQMVSTAQASTGLELTTRAAERGLAEAQLALGLALARGRGREVPQDLTNAQYWLREAASQGHAPAQCALADFLLADGTDTPDLEAALEHYRKAAHKFHPPAKVALELLGARGIGRKSPSGRRRGGTERRHDAHEWAQAAAAGDPQSKYFFGLMCERGLGVPQDLEQAQLWYERAARQGERSAQVALARLLAQRFDPQARDWWEMAAHAGHPEAQAALGRHLLERNSAPDGANTLQALAWLAQSAVGDQPDAMRDLAQWIQSQPQQLALAAWSRAAELGDAHAQYTLAQKLAKGDGVPVQPQRAFDLYQRAALQGHASAQCALGACWNAGKIVQRNVEQALHWFAQAAEQGDAAAQWNLAALYMSGAPGLSKDLRQAYSWCKKSADQGFAAAHATLGVIYVGMQDLEKALHHLRIAAQDGDMEAQYNLAIMLGKGQGVPADPIAAFHWMHEAAQQGLAAAQRMLSAMIQSGVGTAADPLEAHKWLLLAADSGDAQARNQIAAAEERLLSAQIAEAHRRVKVHRAATSVN